MKEKKSMQEEERSEKTGAIQAEGDYARWIEENEWDRMEVHSLNYTPLISVVIPVYNVKEEQLQDCVNSVQSQTYENWELILVDDCSTWEEVRRALQRYEQVPGIRVLYREKNGNISEATNTGLDAAEGEFVAFADCDDVLAENALFEVARALNRNPEYDFLYSDEDKLSEDGKYRHDPFFKPDWSPDTYMCANYTNHLSVFRMSIVKQTGGLRTSFNGSQDYDFTLRFMEHSNNKKVCHIPKVLYYWRERKESVASAIEAKPYTLEAAKNAKEEMLKRRGLNGRLELVEDMQQYRVVYKNPEAPLVSIIIPSKDNFVMLKRCLDTLTGYTAYPNYEIIIVDNGSGDRVKNQIEKHIKGKEIFYYYEKMPFNFSKMCNIGAQKGKGEFYLFLNDDMEIFQSDWLDRLVGHGSLKHCGAVGAKLYYPDSTMLQHDGVVIFDIGPVHALQKMDDVYSYYFGRNRLDYNYIAVTGACLLVGKEKYWQVGGFDEELAVTYNDIDLCVKLYKAGYYNVVRNDVTLFHHESASRGDDQKDAGKMERLVRERKRLFQKYPDICMNDPFYSPNLTRYTIDFKINNRIESHMTQTERFVEREYEQSEATRFSIDAVRVIDGCFLMTGWGMNRQIFGDGAAERGILLEGSDGERYALAVRDVFRADVIELFSEDKRDTAQYGFSICIPCDILNLEMADYKIRYLMTDGQRYLIAPWPSTVKEMLGTDVSLCPGMECRFEKDLLPCDEADDLRFQIEQIKENTDEYLIEGWCFKKQMDINWRKQILFIADGKFCFSCNVERLERIDVALAYADIPFILYCGFRCTVKKRELERLGEKVRIGILCTEKCSGQNRKLKLTEHEIINGQRRHHGECD